jgi:hypothetical protein
VFTPSTILIPPTFGLAQTPHLQTPHQDNTDNTSVLPSRGDCGYPGLVVEKDRALISYYSQHDVDEGPEPKPGE